MKSAHGLERITLKSRNDWVLQHLKRYNFACKFVKNQVVLDIACGIGYGSDILLRKGKAKKVFGADISQEAIDYCNKNYSKYGSNFQVVDATNIKFPENFFETVVSFETIEHINNYEKYLSEIHRVLKRKGTYLLSTPNKNFDKQLPIPSFHVKEFSLDELKFYLEKHNFHIVKILGLNFCNKILLNKNLIIKRRQGIWYKLTKFILYKIPIKFLYVRNKDRYWKLFRNFIENKIFKIPSFEDTLPKTQDDIILDNNTKKAKSFLIICKKN